MGSDLILPAGDLAQQIVSSVVPHSEESRGIWGSQTNMDRIEMAMMNADAGYMTDLTDLSYDILKLDPHMSSQCAKRFGALQAADYDVTPPPEVDKADKKWADEIATKTAQILRGLNSFPERVKDLAWSNFFGRGLHETMWQPGAYDLPVAPVSLRWIHPRRLSFDRQRRIHVSNAWGAHGFDPTPESCIENYPGKFVSWTPRLFNEYPEREGLAPRLVYWGFFKRFDWRMRMKLMELFGIPWRIVHLDTPAGTVAQPEAIKSAREQAEKLGGEAVGVFSKGVEVDISFPPERSGQFFAMTAKEIDDQVSKLILGNVGTTDPDANRANSVIQKGEQDIIWANDGVGASWRLTQDLARPIARAGWGPSAEHLAAIITLRTQPPRDRKAELDRFEKVLSFGVSVPEAIIREAGGVRAPAPDETYIVMGKGGTDAFGNPVPGTYKVVDPNKPGGGPAGGGPPTGPGAPTPGGDDPEPPEPAGDGSPEADGQDGAAARAVADLLGMARAMERLPMEAQTPDQKKLVPASAVHGSPEVLVDRGLKDGVRAVGPWTTAMLAAADGGGPGPQLHRRLSEAAKDLDVEAFARALERRLVIGLALGALDSDWESENDRVVKPPAFGVNIESEADRDLAHVLGAKVLAGGVVDFVAMPFQEAIRFFKAKEVLSKRAFDRLAADAKRRAFTAARLTTERLLQVAHAELTRALEDGRDLREFRMMLDERFELAGWSKDNPSHIENVFRTNIMGAYSSGRDVQMRQPHVLAARPYWQILGVKDARTREAHRNALGKVLRADDPFWKRTGGAPFGFQCRCRKVSRSAEQVEKLGLDVVDGSTLTGLPDEGWDNTGLSFA